MVQYSSILRFLEAERERYILEAAELERRLQDIHDQITSLETLMSGYAKEEQLYSSQKLLAESSTQAILESNFTEELEVEEFEEIELQNHQQHKSSDLKREEDSIQQSKKNVNKFASSPNHSPASNNQSPKGGMESTVAEVEADISDIPKLTTPRKPDSLPLRGEFQNYSVQNAILILMRRQPKAHFNIEVIARELYGDDLTSEQFKTAKMNVGKALSSGVQTGLWHRVSRAIGVYTLHYEKGVTSKPSNYR
jgi:hypothetical protein